MKIVPTQDQLDLQATLRSVLAKHCPTTLVRELRDPAADAWPKHLVAALADVGALGLATDEAHGGSGAGLYELGLFFAEAGRALCPSSIYSSLLLGVALGRLGTPAQQERHLPALAAGELRATTAISNPADAGDVRPVLTAVPAEGGGWALSGTLPFVVNAEGAEVVLVTARARVYAEPTRTLGFLVDPTAAGWQAQALETMSGERVSRVVLTDVLVPATAVLAGQDGRGLSTDDLRWVANAAVALQCMEMVGGTAAVLDQTVAHISTREQFGRPIGSFQAAQHLVADIHIALDAARLAAHSAVWWLGRGECATRPVAIATMRCNEAYKWATLNAHQLHGGMGYVRETDLHLWSERAKTTEVWGGTADVAARWLQEELGLVH
ncbi:acyl-CoA dehydrogenase family protein [Rhodococcus sp. X156]|uniref:acyl-CoA dehydrogenase family protein n=1 Tax=Rhodococcus sp. X156 TaxID=2499145 RepID=UPI000FDB624F|nr:acyl-CoA dehydrogenase family protein [Rhodococcus sp. X156]